jgi:hypothetical protein
MKSWKGVLLVLLLLLPGAGRAQKKPTCAVATFEARGGVTPDEAAILCDWFESEVIGLDRYTLVTRARMEEILKAQKVSLICNDATCAVEMGKILAAQYIIFGAIGKVGSSYVVIATLANVETAELERTARYEQEGHINELLKYGIPATARKLLGVTGAAAGKEGATPVLGGTDLSDLMDQLREKEEEQKRLDREREEARKNLADELARRQAQFENEYAAYLEVIQSPHADDGMKRAAWKRLTDAWGVKDAGIEPRALVWDEKTGLLTVTGFALGAGRSMINSIGMELLPVPGLDVLFAKYEVTNKEYRHFKSDHDSGAYLGHSLNGDRQPVVNVSWNEAKAFCAWLTEKERREGLIAPDQAYRLPTDWEWSVAVGLDESPYGTPESKDEKIKGLYPWGRQWPPPREAGNYRGQEGAGNWEKITGYEDDYPVTAPVGSFAANQFGLYDLGGNVWEWCEDKVNPSEPWRVLRGGSWVYVGPGGLLSSSRDGGGPGRRFVSSGFRVVLELSSL